MRDFSEYRKEQMRDWRMRFWHLVLWPGEAINFHCQMWRAKRRMKRLGPLMQHLALHHYAPVAVFVYPYDGFSIRVNGLNLDNDDSDPVTALEAYHQRMYHQE